MELTQRKLIQVAEFIRSRLLILRQKRLQAVIMKVATLLEDLSFLRRHRGLLAYAIDMNWMAASKEVTERIQGRASDLPGTAEEIQRLATIGLSNPPSLREILADLDQAQEEFESLHFVPEQKQLVVTTEAIELEEVYLGEFDIQLDLTCLSDLGRHASAYRVIAKDPHPPDKDLSVTHPHVNDDTLCEGEGKTAIANALANGRICDFFQLVNGILRTYNPHSPFVSLEDWNGRDCYDCGSTMVEDNYHYCQSCENEFCARCASYCRICDDTTCRSCLTKCSICGDPVCRSCRVSCPDCNSVLCKTCSEERQCDCVQEEEKSANQPDAAAPSENPPIPVAVMQ